MGNQRNFAEKKISKSDEIQAINREIINSFYSYNNNEKNQANNKTINYLILQPEVGRTSDFFSSVERDIARGFLFLIVIKVIKRDQRCLAC